MAASVTSPSSQQLHFLDGNFALQAGELGYFFINLTQAWWHLWIGEYRIQGRLGERKRGPFGEIITREITELDYPAPPVHGKRESAAELPFYWDLVCGSQTINPAEVAVRRGKRGAPIKESIFHYQLQGKQNTNFWVQYPEGNCNYDGEIDWATVYIK